MLLEEMMLSYGTMLFEGILMLSDSSGVDDRMVLPEEDATRRSDAK